MSKISKEEKVTLYVTPGELREIADILESKWAKSKLGFEVPSYEFFSREVTVRLMIDQDRIHEETRQPKKESGR